MTRACDDCQACCVALPIEDLAKPAGMSCSQLCETGCIIYSTRPPVCSSFKCLWLFGQFKNKDRPDKSGLVLARVLVDGGQVTKAWELRPGAAKTVTGRRLLRAARQDGVTAQQIFTAEAA